MQKVGREAGKSLLNAAQGLHLPVFRIEAISRDARVMAVGKSFGPFIIYGLGSN